MATRLFSKDPLSGGQILFLWVGGLFVATLPVIAAALMWDFGHLALRRADRLDDEVERLAARLPESIFEREGGRIVGLVPFPARDPDAPQLSEEEESRVAELVDATLESFRELADSFGVSSLIEAGLVYDRNDAEEVVLLLQEAQSERRGARRWFGGAIALLLISAGGVAFLIWRSFHGAARTQRQ